MWHYLGFLDLAVEILAIVREERLGVRVSNESIGTASGSSTLISCGQLLIRISLPNGLRRPLLIVEAIFSRILSKAPVLIFLSRHGELALRLGYLRREAAHLFRFNLRC